MATDLTTNPTTEISWQRQTPAQLFLVGFMASGKSTVGPVLAAQLGRPFIDLDRLIEAQARCTIAALIQRDGEAHFRQLETATLRNASQGELAVIAPGGGAITRAENRDLMRGAGTILWLDAPFALCWQRIQTDGATRPLAPDETTARARYEQRLPLYQSASVRVPIHPAQSAGEIAAACLHQLNSL